MYFSESLLLALPNNVIRQSELIQPLQKERKRFSHFCLEYDAIILRLFPFKLFFVLICVSNEHKHLSPTCQLHKNIHLSFSFSLPKIKIRELEKIMTTSTHTTTQIDFQTSFFRSEKKDCIAC